MYIMVVVFPFLAKMIAPVVANELVKQVKKLEDGGAVDKTQMALVHKGEFMLPAGVKPTPAQRKAVAARKKTAAKKPAQKPARKPAARKPRIRKPTNNLVKTKKRKGKK